MLFGVLIDWVLRKACDGHGMFIRKQFCTLRDVQEESRRLSNLNFVDDMI